MKINKNLVIVSILLLLLAACSAGNQTSVSNSIQSQSQNQGQASSNNAVKLQDTPYYSYAYQIFPGDLSSDAQQALLGFNMTTQTLADGSTQVSLTPIRQNGEYSAQQFVVKQGDTLYFIETNFGDDFQDGNTSGDSSLGDDRGVLVDQNGYIIQ